MLFTDIPAFFLCVQYMPSMDESQLKVKVVKVLESLRNTLIFYKTFMLHKETKVLY